MVKKLISLHQTPFRPLGKLSKLVAGRLAPSRHSSLTHQLLRRSLYICCRDVTVKVLGYPPAAKLLELSVHEPVKGSVDSGDKGSAAGA